MNELKLEIHAMYEPLTPETQILKIRGETLDVPDITLYDAGIVSGRVVKVFNHPAPILFL